MKDYLKERRADFQRRAAFAPRSVYVHQHRGIRYIPVHPFAEEASPELAVDRLPAETTVLPPGKIVDAWCELPTDVALIESWSRMHAPRAAGIYACRGRQSLRFLKVHISLDRAEITRATFEAMLELVMDHPLAADGFSAVVAGAEPIVLVANI